MEQIRGQLDPSNQAKLDQGAEILKRGRATDAEACGVFSLMAEIQGQPEGSVAVANIVPSKDDPRGMNAQTCEDGRFVSVQIEGDPLAPEVDDGRTSLRTGRGDPRGVR